MFCSLLTRCTIPFARHTKRHLNVQRCSVPVSFFALLTWTCASRRNCVHFFDITTSKSAPNMVCFAHFDFPTCASRHNGEHFFDISTSKSVPNVMCFVHFDFETCFAPQRRAIFHLSRADGSAPAALANLLFNPPEPQIIGKTQCFATLLPFRAPASSFFSLFLFSDLPSFALLFSDSLPTSSFPSVHIVGSLAF